MKVTDILNILGRGNVLLLDEGEVHLGYTIERKGQAFEAVGVEGPMGCSKAVGVILRPNDLVPECFEVGDELVFKSDKL